MKNDYYTYAYLREDGTPYYIGKGRGKRCFIDRGRAISCPPKDRVLFLKKNLTEEEAFRHEVYLIAVLGRKDLGTGILRNLTDGGDGPSGRVVSEEHRAKLSMANKGKKKGPLSEEHRAKLSEAGKNRRHSEDTKAKMSAAKKGRKYSETHRANMSEAKKGKSPSAETRAKLSMANKGKKLSAETRAKMSEARKGNKNALKKKKVR